MPVISVILNSNAFRPYEQITVDESEFSLVLDKFYQEKACYEHGDQYIAQLNSLIDKLASFVLNNEFITDRAQVEQDVALLKEKLKDTSYVANDKKIQKSYYMTYKKNLETVFFLIKDWDEIEKRNFIRRLGERVMVCATGAYTQLSEIIFELTKKPCLNSWLAELRKNILTQFAEEWIAAHNIGDNYSMHVHYFCQEYAEQVGWGITRLIKGYNDERFKPTELNNDTQLQLHYYFLKNYNYQAIKDNIVLNFNLLLAPYIDTLVTPDLNTNICSILAPFLGHEIFDLNAVYSYDNNEWRINATFKKNLPSYVSALLLKEGMVTDLLAPTIRSAKSTLEKEKNRLLEKNKSDQRIQILDNTISFLDKELNLASDDLAKIVNYIEEIYLGHQLDKYNYLEKIGIRLLNTLLILPVGIPLLIKYKATGSYFFSSCGRTHEVLEEVREQLLLANV